MANVYVYDAGMYCEHCTPDEYQTDVEVDDSEGNPVTSFSTQYAPTYELAYDCGDCGALIPYACEGCFEPFIELDDEISCTC